MIYKVGICGIGFVGGAMMKSFEEKGYKIDLDLFIYDKYKNLGSFESLINSDILFLALPTLYNEQLKSYDMTAICETLNRLSKLNFPGVVVLKSTVEPTTTEEFANKYKLNLVHNPEFLTARTAFNDFHNQKHIILGVTTKCQKNKLNAVKYFYKNNYPDADISICTSVESESMKLFLNSFYATKVQFFTEIYLLCNKLEVDYETVKNLMLKNGWINPMHTKIPGPDGLISYGGLCFPKDTNALLNFMKKNNSPNNVISATIEERNIMRDDHKDDHNTKN